MINRRTLLGSAAASPFLSLPAFSIHSPVEYLLYGALGVGVGVVGVVVSKVM